MDHPVDEPNQPILDEKIIVDQLVISSLSTSDRLKTAPNSSVALLKSRSRSNLCGKNVSEYNSKRTSVVLPTPISEAAQVNHPDSLPKDA
ncbi:unnamed protein product [Clonostachys rosea f. rosea IK726]|uniref:Uncharacterized protein n=1 Tax=Clonostachys rosea f. rosea IK726 TaxID=1349383 RepID=A0ACA9U1A0_BIOOC|nr:unnamed protein product [Clonostachys rosea f. rosea IK726]